MFLRALLLVSLFCTEGCLPWYAITSGVEGPVGTTSSGVLFSGMRMSTEEKCCNFYRDDARLYGTSQMVDLLKNTSEKVKKQTPGRGLYVGDISGSYGGKISGHRSHRGGRDVDLAFFTLSKGGSELSPMPMSIYDRFGIAIREKRFVMFDVERNWAIVEALLSDETIDVQWIFVSNGVKARLLSYALNSNKDIEIAQRASQVLHQPGDSAPHDDHFHVRIYCSIGNDGRACVDTRPLWPWVEKANSEKKILSDRQLLALALEDM